jgi:hypothetical protein
VARRALVGSPGTGSRATGDHGNNFCDVAKTPDAGAVAAIVGKCAVHVGWQVESSDSLRSIRRTRPQLRPVGCSIEK